MKIHHDQFVAVLQAASAGAGGPDSLPALLRLAMPAITTLRDNGVGWKWLGPRILAVHKDPEASVAPDLPDLAPERVRDLVAEFSRQKRAAQATGSGVPKTLPILMAEPRPNQTAPPLRSESRSPPTSSRSSIHAAAELNASLGKLQS